MKVRLRIMQAGIVLLALQASAQTLPPQTANAMCRTPSSTGDGAVFQCASEVAQLTAPAGFAFAQATLKGGIVGSGGPKPVCEVEWSQFVAVPADSASTQPRILTLRARANSQRGYGRRGAGWANCSYTVQLVPYAAP